MTATSQIKKKIKDTLRPIAAIRFDIERLKYPSSSLLTKETGNSLLHDRIANGTAFSAAKIGATELDVLKKYLKNKTSKKIEWGSLADQAFTNAGVFPPTELGMRQFCEKYLTAIEHIDMMCTWFRWGESKIVKSHAPSAERIPMDALDPFYSESPWTAALAGKRVLVVSPFAATIAHQYSKRRLIWKGREQILPDFDLQTIRAPLSAALVPPTDLNWSIALDRMSDEAANRQYDVGIIGAGAWSLPLAARMAQAGKIGIHLGGSTQILFGIKGGRWENHSQISRFFNENWCRPSRTETPAQSDKVESSCYW